MKKNDLVSDFELPDQSGVVRSLSEFLAQGAVVLFFYPAAMSWGCSSETRMFRDLASEFAAVGGQPVGLSPDAVTRQCEFAARESLAMPLLSDVDGKVASQFGVKRRFGPIPVRRRTFVISQEGRVVDVVKSEIRMTLHADRALEVLRQAKRMARP